MNHLLFKIFVCLSLLILPGCGGGGFDITRPWVTLTPSERHIDEYRVTWVDYDKAEIAELPHMGYRGCIFVYFTTAIGCGPDCIITEDSFRDQEIVYALNEFYMRYRVDEYNPDWEEALQRFGVKDIPHTFIIKFNAPDDIVPTIPILNYQGAWSVGHLNHILESVDCNDKYN